MKRPYVNINDVKKKKEKKSFEQIYQLIEERDM